MKGAHVSLSFTSEKSLEELQHSQSHPESFFLCFFCSVFCSHPMCGWSLLSFCPGPLPLLCLNNVGPSAALTPSPEPQTAAEWQLADFSPPSLVCINLFLFLPLHSACALLLSLCACMNEGVCVGGLRPCAQTSARLRENDCDKVWKGTRVPLDIWDPSCSLLFCLLGSSPFHPPPPPTPTPPPLPLCRQANKVPQKTPISACMLLPLAWIFFPSPLRSSTHRQTEIELPFSLMPWGSTYLTVWQHSFQSFFDLAKTESFFTMLSFYRPNSLYSKVTICFF